jgi:hypothetical protein
MRGIAYFNFAAFKAAAEDLRERGYFVFSPAERDIEICGADPSNPTGCPMQAELEHGLTLRDCLADDLIWICRNATAVVVLPGWEGSKGAQAEVHTARALGIPVLTLDEALRAW